MFLAFFCLPEKIACYPVTRYTMLLLPADRMLLYRLARPDLHALYAHRGFQEGRAESMQAVPMGKRYLFYYLCIYKVNENRDEKKYKYSMSGPLPPWRSLL